MKTAREFYYSYYEQESTQRSFQQKSMDINPGYWILLDIDGSEKHHQGVKDIFNFKPQYSNDIRIESIYKDLIANVAPEIQCKMNRIFVAHTYDNDLQAYVKDHSHEIDGEIVFIEYGLSTEIIFYSNVFTILYSAIIGHKESPWLVDELKSGLDLLCQLQLVRSGKKDLKTALNHEHIDFLLNVEPKIRHQSAYFVQAALSFLVSHEVAHYLLGHLKGHNSFNKWVSFTFSDIFTAPYEHQKEFCSDIFGILLSSNCLGHLPALPAQVKPTISASFGAQLLFTVLGQYGDCYHDSKLYPRILHRYNICLNLLDKTMDKSAFHTSLSLSKSFQKLLYKKQGFGLGEIIPHDHYILPWEE